METSPCRLAIQLEAIVNGLILDYSVEKVLVKLFHAQDPGRRLSPD